MEDTQIGDESIEDIYTARLGSGDVWNVSMTLRHVVVEISEQSKCRGLVMGGLREFKLWQVDTDEIPQGGRCRWASLEVLGMGRVECLQDATAMFVDGA